MTSGKKIKVVNAILCEDARREEGTSKGILIGVFAGDIIIPELPGNIQLAIYLEVQTDPGDHVAALRVSGPQKGMSATMRAHLHSDAANSISVIATPRFGILLQKEGTLKVEGQIDDGAWSTLISKKVIVRAPT